MVLVLACGLLAAQPVQVVKAQTEQGASASPDDARQTALARSLFQEGVQLGEADQWPEAADRFERALALRNSPNLEHNLAIAYEHSGRIVEAIERFRRVAASARADRRLKDAARQRIRALEPRVARLMVTAAT